MESADRFRYKVWEQDEIDTADNFSATTRYQDAYFLWASLRQSQPREQAWASQLGYRADWRVSIRYGRRSTALQQGGYLRLVVDGASHLVRITRVRDRGLRHQVLDFDTEELHAR